MADEKKKEEKKAAEEAAKEKNTTDTNAGPDADMGDGKYHAAAPPQRHE